MELELLGAWDWGVQQQTYRMEETYKLAKINTKRKVLSEISPVSGVKVLPYKPK